MRMFMMGMAAAALAGCQLLTIDEGNGTGPAAGPAAGNMAAPGAPGAPAAPGGRRNSREVMIADCSVDLGRSLPAGTDITALCTCSVDRMLARVPQRDAVRQCAAELRITLPGGQ
ncbi:hypothetical protein [Sphingosinicella sp.]|uniref:hypothetical protein n=1 Tax=Sphingosinicella sp. TaxID=1917971 RepID=UPI00403772B8